MRKAGNHQAVSTTVGRLIAFLAVLSLIGAACSSDGVDDAATGTNAPTDTQADDTQAGDDESDPGKSDDAESVDFNGDSGSEFCRKAIAYDEDPPGADYSFADPLFFESSAAALQEMAAIAPAEIRDDLDTVRAMTQQFADAVRPFDGDALNAELATAMDSIDTTRADEAGDRIEAYLEQVCGLESGGEIDISDATVPALDPDFLEGLSEDEAQIAVIQQMFGVDEELATCLATELGDLSDAAELDPSTATQEICGTSMLELITGLGQG